MFNFYVASIMLLEAFAVCIKIPVVLSRKLGPSEFYSFIDSKILFKVPVSEFILSLSKVLIALLDAIQFLKTSQWNIEYF